MGEQLGRVLMVLGGALLLAGLVVWLASRWLAPGGLPGDVHWQRDRVEVHFPLGTMLLVSLLLTLVLNLILWLRR